jgi:arginine deiminase
MMLGAQTEVGRIRTMVVKHARDAFRNQVEVDCQWEALGYLGRPDFLRATAEYDGFRALLEGLGVEIHLLPAAGTVGLDSLYPRDAALVCDRGIILASMGKEARAGEPDAMKTAFHGLGVPIYGRIEGAGRLEGGDVAWMDSRTLAVGRGYRTNDEGIRQLRDLVADCVDQLVVVPLPHWRGPGIVFHLMSFYSPLDTDLALVFSRLLPVPFRELLLERGVRLVEVPDEEFETMGSNALAVAPRKCILLAGNPETRARLEAAGVEVHEFEGEEISRKGCGGPTCLTRPVAREPP